MNVSKSLTIFYVIVTLLLAIPGAWLLFAPEMALVTIHENLAMIQVSNIHSQQTGLGLLLAAALPRPSLPGKNGQQRGEVKWFNPNKGFGFILTDSGEELFVHFKAVQNGGRRSLRTGTKVRFDTRMSDRGEQADNVYIEQ